MLRSSLMSSPHISPYLPIDLGEVADVAQLAEGRRHILAAGDVRLQASSRTEQTQQRVRLVTYGGSSSSSSSSSSKGWGGASTAGWPRCRSRSAPRGGGAAATAGQTRSRRAYSLHRWSSEGMSFLLTAREPAHTLGCLGARVLSSVGGASSRCAASRCSAIRSSATAHA